MSTLLELKDLGNEAYRKGEHEKAIEYYSEAINKAEPKEMDLHLIYSNRAMIFNVLERYEEALLDSQKVIDLCPTFLKGYLRAAMALKGLGRKREALECAKRGLALESASSSAGAPELSKFTKTVEKELTLAKRKFEAKSPQEAQEMMQEYQQRYQEIQRLRMEMEQKQRTYQVDKLTLDYLQQVEKPTRAFVSVGRMFVQRPTELVEGNLKLGLDQMTQEFEALKDKMKTMETKFSSLAKELEEVM